MDGDLLAVHKTQDVRDGQVVVARVDDDVTVKRLERKGSTVLLHAENEEFSPIRRSRISALVYWRSCCWYIIPAYRTGCNQLQTSYWYLFSITCYCNWYSLSSSLSRYKEDDDNQTKPQIKYRYSYAALTLIKVSADQASTPRTSSSDKPRSTPLVSQPRESLADDGLVYDLLQLKLVSVAS